MKEHDNDFEQAKAYKTVVERLWTEPVLDACGDALPRLESATLLVAEARCGYVPLEIAPRMGPNTRVMALDSHGPMLDLARKRAEGREGEDSIYFVNQRVGNLSYADGVFQAGICLDGIYTGRQADEGIGELARVTADEGTVVVATPLATSFSEFYDMLDEALRAQGLVDVCARVDKIQDSLISPGRLASVAASAGLTDVSVDQIEWQVGFEGGRDFLHSPLVRETFFPHWIGLVRSSEREPVLRYISDAIDTYWHGKRFVTSVAAGLMVGRKGA
jgi:SAM-dependent methyltransferase